jgi:hypothetical protein
MLAPDKDANEHFALLRVGGVKEGTTYNLFRSLQRILFSG